MGKSKSEQEHCSAFEILKMIKVIHMPGGGGTHL